MRRKIDRKKIVDAMSFVLWRPSRTKEGRFICECMKQIFLWGKCAGNDSDKMMMLWSGQ